MLRRIKAAPATRSIPVVMMTGHVVDTSHHDGPHAAAATVLLKPISTPTLIETLTSFLRSNPTTEPE